MKIRVASLLLVMLVASRAPGSQPTAQSPSGPKLLVVVVVDQLRFDYLGRFDRFWREGLKRLLTEGAVFERAYYPYVNTVTCTGHATIGTGAFPATHGVVLNEWWQRAAGRNMSCTEDPKVASVSYGGPPEPIGHSARRLRVRTMADRLRAASPQSRVVSLSMKPRSAVMLAGHAGEVVAWFGSRHRWATSTAYARAAVPAVTAFVKANPVEKDRHTVWQRVLKTKSYSGNDDGVGERPTGGWTPVFPHALAGSSEQQFYSRWERSPYSDAYLGSMAAALVRSQRLGQRGAVDFLGVSFSSLDYVGHDFGPDSHEVQDTLIRLDRVLGTLFEALDTLVGRDRYVVAVSADHGVSPIPEARLRQGQDAGRVLKEDVHRIAEAAMVVAHGPGPYVAHVEYTDIYLTDRARRLVGRKPGLLQPLIEAVEKMPGVQRVLRTDGLERKRISADAAERAAALSYYAGASGDAVIIFKPYWINTDLSAATHGSMQPYDQHVPVILMGPPFKAGRYRDIVSPADIAPTLASLINLALPGVDGRVLTMATGQGVASASRAKERGQNRARRISG